MTKFTWLAVALIGSSLVAASPVAAQIGIGVGPNGPSVQIGSDRDRQVERRVIRRDDTISTGSVTNCRTVITKTENSNGDMVTKRVKRC